MLDDSADKQPRGSHEPHYTTSSGLEVKAVHSDSGATHSLSSGDSGPASSDAAGGALAVIGKPALNGFLITFEGSSADRSMTHRRRALHRCPDRPALGSAGTRPGGRNAVPQALQSVRSRRRRRP